MRERHQRESHGNIFKVQNNNNKIKTSEHVFDDLLLFLNIELENGYLIKRVS